MYSVNHIHTSIFICFEFRGTIAVEGQLGLDDIFNPEEVNTDSLSHGSGTYRVYAAFCDFEGNILFTSDNMELDSWYEFEVSKYDLFYSK